MNKNWEDLARKNIDLIISIIITILIYIIGQISVIKITLDYPLFSSLFLGVFAVNFTVFAISNYLVENYYKIKDKKDRMDVDAIFKTPLKISMSGLILSLILIILNASFFIFLNPILILLLIYSIISSYFVFKFLYELSIKRKR